MYYNNLSIYPISYEFQDICSKLHTISYELQAIIIRLKVIHKFKRFFLNYRQLVIIKLQVIIVLNLQQFVLIYKQLVLN